MATPRKLLKILKILSIIPKIDKFHSGLSKEVSNWGSWRKEWVEWANKYISWYENHRLTDQINRENSF